MGKRRIIEIHYPDFVRATQAAVRLKKKIMPSEKEAWQAYVRKHDVPEAGFRVHANAGTMLGKVDAVIIDGAGDIDGYYLYSADEQFCMKFESGLD